MLRLRTLPGGKAERFGMGPPVVPGQRLAEGAGPVGHGPLAYLAAGDRKLGDGDRKTALYISCHDTRAAGPLAAL